MERSTPPPCGTEASGGAEGALAALERIMAVAGHDLRQPLQLAVMSISRAMTAGLDVRAATRLGTALTALRRLDRELEELAVLSQARRHATPDRRAVPLGRVFADLESDWRTYALECGVELVFSPRDVVVESDPAMLRTILRNLLGNALKYAGANGRVHVGPRLRDRFVSVEIRDNGCGIPDAMLGPIFESLHRGGRVGTRDGLGLGLHIVKETAGILGHQVNVRSTEGFGSVFSVLVPRAAAGA